MQDDKVIPSRSPAPRCHHSRPKPRDPTSTSTTYDSLTTHYDFQRESPRYNFHDAPFTSTRSPSKRYFFNAGLAFIQRNISIAGNTPVYFSSTFNELSSFFLTKAQTVLLTRDVLSSRSGAGMGARRNAKQKISTFRVGVL